LLASLSWRDETEVGTNLYTFKQPRILLLDEPTIGIDPISRRELWELVIDMTIKEDIISIISTTYIQEADYMDKLILVEEGK